MDRVVSFDENTRNTRAQSSRLGDAWRRMTRVIVDANGALSASTGAFVRRGTGAEWNRRGSGETRFWPWSERKSQEFARTDQYCPRTWICLFLSAPFSLSLSLVLSSVKIPSVCPVLFHLLLPFPLPFPRYYSDSSTSVSLFLHFFFLLFFCTSFPPHPVLHRVQGIYAHLFLPL